MDIKTSKSILAKLLAQEDITVVHGKVQTASFDTKNRVLTLPIWKDMDGDLYDLLCGHEVGHALNTPAQGWHDAIMPDGKYENVNHILKGYLNVLEDARIEKKIKTRYPGLRASFYRAYQGLFDRDFFQVKDKPLGELLLIDRINLHFKLGSFIAVPFSGKEKSVIKRVEELETWEQVEALARELMALAETELEEKKDQIKKKLVIRIGAGEMADDDQDANLDEYDEIEYEFDDSYDDGRADLSQEERDTLDRESVASETDRAFREAEDSLLDHASRAYEYVNMPNIKAAPYIVGYRDVMAELQFQPEYEVHAIPTLNAFRKKNMSVIDYLVKEFELRRNAQQQLRAKVSKSGEIDVKKLFSYRYNEDLFRRVTTMPMGKNHGLVLFFDMSGSMSQQMGAAIEQMLVLVEFCRKVSIPFEVYGFTNSQDGEGAVDWARNFAQRQPNIQLGDLVISDHYFRLRQYFTDRMSPADYKRQLANLALVARIWHKRAHRWSRRPYDTPDPIGLDLPRSEDLNGTPLNPALLLAIDIYNKFIERTRAEVVNMVVLTDGDTDGTLEYKTEYLDWNKQMQRSSRNIHSPAKYNVVITHRETRKTVRLDDTDDRGTSALVSMIREVTGANVVCFDIVTSAGRRVIQNKMFRKEYNLTPEQYARTEQAAKIFRRDRLYVIDTLGYNEYYLIPGGSDLDIEDDELAVEAGADKKKILKAFSEMQDNKKSSRILLNRFVKMIA